MRALPLVPDGCTLSPDGLALQLVRAERLAPAVAGLIRSERRLDVTFAPGVDEALVGALVETERDCCSFLSVGYDADARRLRVESDDPRGGEVVAQLGAFFAGEGR